MVAVPAAIIIVNNDLSESAQAKLVTQLHISEVVDGATFDARIAADAAYPTTLRQLNQRLMVVRTHWDRAEVATWTEADVVIFVKNGLAAVEKNLFGPPGITYKVLELTWPKLCIFERK